MTEREFSAHLKRQVDAATDLARRLPRLLPLLDRGQIWELRKRSSQAAKDLDQFVAQARERGTDAATIRVLGRLQGLWSDILNRIDRT